jgi:hypothetical protein
VSEGGPVPDFIDLWKRSTVAEVSWLTPSGPAAIPVVPLALGEVACAAVPYAHLTEMDSVTDAVAAFSVTDGRLHADDSIWTTLRGRDAVLTALTAWCGDPETDGPEEERGW